MATVDHGWMPQARAIPQGAGFVLRQPIAALAVAHDHELLTSWPTLPRRCPDPPSCVQGDFDGDGADELLVKAGADFHVHALDRVTPLRWVARRAALVDDGSDGPWLSGRACDWNGDGRADLAIARDRDVVVLTDTLAGQWTGIALGSLPEADCDLGVVATAGDFDGDGRPDLVFASPERGLWWCRNDGSRTVPRLGAPQPLWPAEPGVILTALQLHDIDGDGWLDVVGCRAMRAPQGFELRERRRDRNGIEDAELAAATRELDALLQARRRAALGLDFDAPGGPLLGNDAFPMRMPPHEVRLRDRIAALTSRPVPVQAVSTRVWLRRR